MGGRAVTPQTPLLQLMVEERCVNTPDVTGCQAKITATSPSDPPCSADDGALLRTGSQREPQGKQGPRRIT
jgi:hypothetical protein